MIVGATDSGYLGLYIADWGSVTAIKECENITITKNVSTLTVTNGASSSKNISIRFIGLYS